MSHIAEPEDEEEDLVNRQWKQVRSIFDGVSKNCLGMQKTRERKEWITAATWQDIEERDWLKKINDSRLARLQSMGQITQK